MFKNVAGQKIAVFAWDNAAGEAKTGDAGNITAQISKDGGACAATNDINPTELDATDAPGIYLFDPTQAETNADLIVLYPVSSTSDIVLRPVLIYTNPITPTKAGYIDASISTVDTVVDAIKAVTDNLPDSGALTTIDSNVDAILADTNELQTDDVPSLISALNDISVADILTGTVEGAIGVQGALRLLLSFIAGKTSGGGTTTITFRDTEDTKDRIVMTVDTDGNRSTITLDYS